MLKPRKVIVMYLCLLMLVVLSPLTAEITLPGIIDDNMVLQRNTKLKVWGWADAGEKIAVSFAGQTVNTTTAVDGSWKTTLLPVKAGGPYDMTITGKNTLVLKNILVGEVWLCSGQSNMQMTLGSTLRGKETLVNADLPRIRLFTVGRAITDTPQKNCEGQWWR